MHFTPHEKAILFGVELPHENLDLSELQRLAETAGATVVGTISQKRLKPDCQYFIGSGKVEELKSLVFAKAANLAIFDHELSASQERNLSDALGIKVIDRTELILDIFAQRAKTREGKLQVELAQDSFLLTRLTGHGVQMSRLGGGIATRGPGETKLEYDRRRIRARLAELRLEIDRLSSTRAQMREKRRQNQIPLVSLIGYTNAGKSTLLNALTKATVLVEDKLFATLDPTTRRLYLPSGRYILLTDTVGFITKLPHQLIAAFRATLEEVSNADLLLHVVDLSHPEYEKQLTAVYNVLEELKSVTKPIITVLNKIDLADKKIVAREKKRQQPACAISASQKVGLERLLAIIDARLPAQLL